MNYIKHLTGFFEKVATDKTLNPTHVSLYIALFQFWNCNRFKNPISISRDEVMRISKISSKATYHKCLKNLHSLGYINYEPSYNPFKGSHVFLFNFSEDLKPAPKSDRKPKNEPLNELASEQALNKSCTGNETGTEQAVVPSINYRNNTNILNDENGSNLQKHAKNFEEINNSNLKTENSKEQKSSAKKEEMFSTFADSADSKNERQKEMPENLVDEKTNFSSPAFADYNAEHTENSRQKNCAKKKLLETLDDENRQMPQTFADNTKNQTENSRQKDESCHTELVEASHSQKSNPTIEEVKTYFQENSFPELEAQKFFNYFSSIGWLVGGKTPMVNWQAAAQNWMINVPKFISNAEQPNRAKQLNTTTDKDYSEPL